MHDAVGKLYTICLQGIIGTSAVLTQSDAILPDRPLSVRAKQRTTPTGNATRLTMESDVEGVMSKPVIGPKKAMPRGKNATDAWWYENQGSIDVYIETASEIVCCRIQKRRIKEWLTRVERDDERD